MFCNCSNCSNLIKIILKIYFYFVFVVYCICLIYLCLKTMFKNIYYNTEYMNYLFFTYFPHYVKLV